jgi:hypothetical protein
MIEHVVLVGNSTRLPVAKCTWCQKNVFVTFDLIRGQTEGQLGTQMVAMNQVIHSHVFFSNFGRCINAAASSYNVTLFDRLLMMTDTKNVPVIE